MAIIELTFSIHKDHAGAQGNQKSVSVFHYQYSNFTERIYNPQILFQMTLVREQN
jgi:hypothetical protein